MNTNGNEYESSVAVAAARFAEAERNAKRARADLNAAVAEARDHGVRVDRLLELAGWKQPKSVRDAVLAHRKAVGS
jgi:hypothetical protein